MRKINDLEMRGITKSFHGFYANKDINLKISSGEVLGLLGENGAGKTTLMNILYGLYRPDAGEIIINGEDARIKNPKDSMRAGIGMIHQHFMLVQNHTVAENIALGLDDVPFFFPDNYIRKKISGFSQRFDMKIDPDKKIWELSAGEQQRVEILKALFLEADLLIMDEPTSVLTPQESKDLFGIIRKMADDGHSIILISHKLDEIMEICSRVAVIRKGITVGGADIGDVDKKELARMMVGRDVDLRFDKVPLERGERVLEVKELFVNGDRGNTAVNGLSFSVYRNEVFGIAGVSGNGQRELVEAITGLRRSSSGEIILEDDAITNKSARVVNTRGITHVPEERIKFGIVPNLFIYENAILKKHHSKPFSRLMFLDYDLIKNHTENIVERYNISTPSINVPIKSLSGGNIQKLIIGREIESKPALLVASHPTYGLDIGATEYIRRQILARREEGGGVLLVSEDLEELFEICDRIAVIFKGEFMGILKAGDADIKDIGLMMTGSLKLPVQEAE
ncbi:MAG: ABC transporter ATP-binding protein [Spirochaetales bacterium]|nr:ABC transporter ATP-binding protein [Spirochaetales bacterium]